MPFELAVALRYLKSRRHGLFAFVTSLIAIGGVTLGVASLIVTLAVMNGFRSDIQEKTLGIQPHVLLLGTDKDPPADLESLMDRLKRLPDVEAASPFILGQTLVKTSHGTQGIVLRGVAPAGEFRVTGVGKMLISGDWQPLEKSEKFLYLGKELAHNLGAELGEEVYVFSPTESAALGALGSIPKVEVFRVGGVFQSGYYEYDANLALTSLDQARRLFSLAGATGIGLRTKNLDRADKIASEVAESAGIKYWARSWQSMNRNLFEALKLEKIVMTIILTMIVLVASFTIISNLILMTIEKSRDIGILRALGASRASIQKIFLYAGLVLGTLGITLGTAIGIALVQIIEKTRWIKLPQDVYYLDTLPVKLVPLDLALVLVCAFLITLGSAVYPSYYASRMNPAEAIRYG